MIRGPLLFGALSAVAALLAGCPAPFVSCSSDGDCPDGTRCAAGTCAPAASGEGEGEGGEGEGERVQPRILRVDGDGSALGVAGPGPPGALPGAHRVRAELLVTGAHLDAVTSATLVRGSAAAALSHTLVDGEHMRLRLPAGLAPGLATLVLASAAGEARADVFLLQGEPGPPTLFAARAPQNCPSGGVRYAGGVDANKNGVLDPDEEDPALARDVCNGDSIFSCANGTCTSSQALDAPKLSVAGRPVLGHVDAPVTVNVPGDAPTLAAALALFDGIGLDADVDIVLGPGIHDEPATVVVTRGDGSRFRVSGAGGAELHFTDAGAIIVDGGAIGSIKDVVIQGNGNATANGVVAENGGRVVFGSGVVVRGFATGVIAIARGEIAAHGVVSQNNVNGFLSVDSAYLDATGASALGNSGSGFVADKGAVLEAPSCTASGSVNGVVAGHGAVLVATSCSISGNTIGLNALDEGVILAISTRFPSPNTTNAVATVNATIQDDGTPIGASRVVDATSVIAP